MVSLTADMSPLHPDRNLALEQVEPAQASARHGDDLGGQPVDQGRRHRVAGRGRDEHRRGE